MVAPLALELAVQVPLGLGVGVGALVFLQSLDGVGFEGAAFDVTFKMLLLQLDLTFVTLIAVVVSHVGCQGVSRRPVCKGWLFITFGLLKLKKDYDLPS